MRGKLFSLCSIFILRSASYLTLIVSLYAPLPILRFPSHFTLCFSFHAPLLISHSASHFTLPFSFHAPLLISRPLLFLRSASHAPPSHFTLPFSFYAPLLIPPPPPPLLISRSPSRFTLPVSFHALLLILCSSHDLNTWNGRHHLTKTSAVVMWFSVFCSVLQKYLGEHFSSVVRVIDINYCYFGRFLSMNKWIPDSERIHRENR